MKLNAIKFLALTATVGLIAGQAKANTEHRVKSDSTSTTTYGTGTDSSTTGSTTGSTNTTGTSNSTYGSGSDTSTLETTGAPRAKVTSKTSTTTTTPGVMDQSSGSTQDVEVTRMIREGLNSNNSLSTAAKNVEVITLDNVITLRGKVASQTEKQQVASVAQSAGGSRTIHNELTVDTSKQ